MVASNNLNSREMEIHNQRKWLGHKYSTLLYLSTMILFMEKITSLELYNILISINTNTSSLKTHFTEFFKDDFQAFLNWEKAYI